MTGQLYALLAFALAGILTGAALCVALPSFFTITFTALSGVYAWYVYLTILEQKDYASNNS